METSGRLASLDALRGFDMFWILMPTYPIFHALLVALGLGGCWFDVQMDHPEWIGFTFYDTIFPLFLFMAGVSFPYSHASSVKRGLSTAAISLKIVRRIVILYILGALITILYNSAPGWANFRHVSVLGRIGLTWGAAAFLYLFTTGRTRLIVAGALFVLYAAAVGRDLGDQATSTFAWLDDHVFWPYLHAKGTAQLVPMVSTALLGMAAGDLLRIPDSDLPRTAKAGRLALWGVLSAALGLVWAFGLGPLSLPIIKNAWTPTFALVAGGYSFLMLAFFYWIIDVRGWTNWTRPFTIIGMNAIAAYVFSRLVVPLDLMKPFLFGKVAAWLPTPEWGEFVAELGYLVLYWLLLGWMARRKIYLKV